MRLTQIDQLLLEYNIGWRLKSPGKYVAMFVSEKGQNIEVVAARYKNSESTYSLMFHTLEVDDKGKTHRNPNLTGAGDSVKVISTIGEITQKIVAHMYDNNLAPFEVIIHAAEDEPRKRLSLYERILKRYLGEYDPTYQNTGKTLAISFPAV